MPLISALARIMASAFWWRIMAFELLCVSILWYGHRHNRVPCDETSMFLMKFRIRTRYGKEQVAIRSVDHWLHSLIGWATWMIVPNIDVSCENIRPRLHYDVMANTPLKIHDVSSIETILCLHYNRVVCRSALTTDHHICHTENKSISLKIHYVSWYCVYTTV